MQKHRTKDGSDKKEDLDNARVLYSDIMECFRIFKEKTGGILHRDVHIDVNENNCKLVAEKCEEFKEFSFKTTPLKVVDKRSKSGFREETLYTYTYLGEEYTEKELRKRGGVYIDDPIKFDNILELIPYFPYLVTMLYNSENKMVVYISEDSFAEREHIQHLQAGFDSSMIHHYRKELAEIYYDVCKDYLLYKLEERTKIISIEDLVSYDEHNYIMKVKNGIDENHAVKYFWVDGTARTHWCSPKMLDKYTIMLNKQDVDSYLADAIKEGNVKIKYVEYVDFPLYLD